jgi:hypothetical protein
VKICWDNLEKIHLTCHGNFKKGQAKYIEKESCKYCGEPYLSAKYDVNEYCCIACGKLGKHRSKEVKMKISETRKLKGLSKGKNNPMYGRKRVLSEATKRRISIKLSKLRSGKGNTMYGKSGPLSPNWKGGISCEPYCDAWADKEYKESIKERDNYVCQNPDCWHNSKRLCIHHIDYNKKNCKPGNLITVCTSCNARANFDRDWHQSWYQSIINKRYGGK